MTDKEKLVQAENILHDIVMSFEIEGCERCGTVSTAEINKAREFLGWDPLDTPEGEDEDDIRANSILNEPWRHGGSEMTDDEYEESAHAALEEPWKDKD